MKTSKGKKEKVTEKAGIAKKTRKVNMWKAGFVLVSLLFVFFVFREGYCEKNPDAGICATSSGGDKVKLDFYVMSQCPYGTEVEDNIAPVLEKLGKSVDFNLNFIGNVFSTAEFASLNPQAQSMCHLKSDGNYYCSLHGQAEVNGDIIQLCAAKYFPDKYVKLIVCQNKDVKNVATNYVSCGNEIGIDSNKIKSCFESAEGRALFKESIAKADAAQASGSPTILINDAPYQGGRDSNAFLRALCINLKDNQACKELPACAADNECTEQADKIGICRNPNEKDAYCEYIEPVKFELLVLNDNKCSSCDATRIVQITEQLFKGVIVKYVDASDTEGKALISKYSLVYAPSYLFDSKVEQTYTWINQPDLKGSFDKIGDKYKLRDSVTGASYFLSEEKRAEYYKTIGVVLGDNKPQIDFYVMSYCPYGNTAEEAIEGAYQILKDKVYYNPHYVIYSNYGGGGSAYCLDAENKYCSMHGIQELNQDVRELCVNKYEGIDAYFKFVLTMNKKCNSGNADACWESVASSLSLDINKIKDCQKNEALALLKKEVELNELMGVQGSPTVFVEGNEYAGSRSAAGYAKALCNAFDTKPAECNNLPADVPVQSSTATGGCI